VPRQGLPLLLRVRWLLLWRVRQPVQVLVLVLVQVQVQVQVLRPVQPQARWALAPPSCRRQPASRRLPPA
jgi:hypothetical protein